MWSPSDICSMQDKNTIVRNIFTDSHCKHWKSCLLLGFSAEQWRPRRHSVAHRSIWRCWFWHWPTTAGSLSELHGTSAPTSAPYFDTLWMHGDWDWGGRERKKTDWGQVEIHTEKWTKTERGYEPMTCLLSTAHVFIKTKRIHVQTLRHCTYCPHVIDEQKKGKPTRWAGMRNWQVEKWQSRWSGRNEHWGKAGEWGMVVRGDCVGGGWEATYEWGKSSQGWQDGENERWQADAVRKRVRWRDMAGNKGDSWIYVVSSPRDFFLLSICTSTFLAGNVEHSNNTW